MMNRQKGLPVLFCFIFPLLVLLFSYRITLAMTNLTENQQQVIDYLQNDAPLTLPYTAEERSHLEDVKDVMNVVDYFFYGIALVVLGTLFLFRHYQKDFHQLLWYSGLTTIGIILLIGILSLLSFNGLFTLFHQLFFPQGNWQFPAESLLIQTFPLDFFITISSRIFLTTLILGSLFILLSFILKRHASQS